MKVDFDALLKDPKGQEFADKATLGVAVYSVLMQQLPADAQTPAEKRLASYRLLQRVAKGGEQEITVEEAAEIKEQIGRAHV